MAQRRKEPLTQVEKRKINRENLTKLSGIFRYILPYRVKFIIGLVCLVLSSLTLLSFPFFAGKLIDAADGNLLWQQFNINQIALILMAILLVQGVLSFFRVYLFTIVSERSMADIRNDLYHKMMTLPMAFYDQRRTGELLSRITTDVSLLQETFSITLAEFIRQVATLTLGIIIIFITASQLTWFMLAIFPVVVLIAYFFGKFIRKLSKQKQDQLANANVIVEETLQSIQTVKAFTSELYEVLRFRKNLSEAVNTAVLAGKYRGAFISFIIFALFGAIVAVIWYGANLVLAGTMTTGTLLSFVLYTTFIGGSIAGLGDLYGQVQRAIGSSERVLDIIGEQGEYDQLRQHASREVLDGAINFEKVRFTYPTRPEVEVLRGLNLEVQQGSKVALVGPSGAGKSTIIQLLNRFYEIDGGRITIDGKNIYDFELVDLRNWIGMVPQEVILFGGTIRENILYGKHEATNNELQEAASKANALQFINSFPEGFDTLVGERGVKLSGGQRQRIAIARAILKDPKILILDEATSSLDAESERLVQDALDKLMEGRTTIIIAHRLNTIRKVDNIFVINHGQVQESGTHEALSQKKDGNYSNLVKLQLELY